MWVSSYSRGTKKRITDLNRGYVFRNFFQHRGKCPLKVVGFLFGQGFGLFSNLEWNTRRVMICDILNKYFFNVSVLVLKNLSKHLTSQAVSSFVAHPTSQQCSQKLTNYMYMLYKSASCSQAALANETLQTIGLTWARIEPMTPHTTVIAFQSSLPTIIQTWSNFGKALRYLTNHTCQWRFNLCWEDGL